MVRGAVPVLVTVKLSDLDCPSTTLPKLKLDGEIANPAWAPVPLREIARGELVASLAIVIDPVTLPAVVGANVAVSVTLCMALIVVPAVKPLAVNPLPVTVTLETFMALVPVLVSTKA